MAAAVLLTLSALGLVTEPPRAPGPGGPLYVAAIRSSPSMAAVSAPALSPGRSAPASGVAGSAATVNVAWMNQTAAINAEGAPAVSNASLAFDPLLGEMLLFGGCGTSCPTNSTWTYDAGTWSELPADSPLPPSVQGASMAWDPLWAGVLLTGGELSGGTVTNSTWLFNSTGWHNLTASVGGSPDVAFGSMAYDGTTHEMVETDGCSSAVVSCRSALVGQTYLLAGPGSTWTSAASSLSYAGAPAPSFGGALAFDASLAELVYFGGEDSAGAILNATWSLGTGSWTNVSSVTAGCTTFATPCSTPYYPPGAALGGATWDGQLHDLVLEGGILSGGGSSNATSLLLPSGQWFPLSAKTTSDRLPGAGFGSALSSNSSDVAPLLVEGDCVGGVHCRGDAWVLEIPPAPVVLSANPDPAEVGVSVTLTATGTVGNGSGPTMTATLQDTGDHSNVTNLTGVNFSSTIRFTLTAHYSAAGTYGVTASLKDFFGVATTSAKFSLPVNATLTAVPVADRNPTELGTASTFTANAADGVPPYTYLWGFGDGSGGSSEASPTHTYAATGTFDAWVVVTDRLGAVVNASLPVTVDPSLGVSVLTTGGPADAGVPVAFLGDVRGGSGVYTAYLWTFGDGGTAATADADHTFALAGTYPVTLTVADSAGFQASGSVKVVIRPQLATSAIHASSTTPTVDSAVAFNLTVRNGTPNYAYVWSFGDGGQSSDAAPSHTYSAIGTFTVSVTVSDEAGATVTKKLTVTVEKRKESLLGTLTEGTGLYLVVGGSAVVAGLAAYLVVARSGRRRSAAPPPPPEGGSPSDVPPPPGGEAPPG